MLEPDFKRNFKKTNQKALRREIKKARSKTKGVLGVNIMVSLTDFGDLVRVSIEEKTEILFLGAGGVFSDMGPSSFQSRGKRSTDGYKICNN